jgi:hypothetical protein
MDIQKTIDAFQQVFNNDVAQTILSFAEPELIILLQNSFPHLLKNITVTNDNLHLINTNNYKFIKKMNISDVKTFDENILSKFHNLTELNCWNCLNITDKGVQHLVRLTKLDCWNCRNITDVGIQHLVRLTELNCWNCPNITDVGIQHLVRLTKLYCWNCPNITDIGIQHLVRLTELNCSNCQNITDVGIQHLVRLTKLNCWNCPNISDNMKRIIVARNR